MKPAYESAPLAAGAYTLPDAAHLLGLPAARLRAWVNGVSEKSDRHHPAGLLAAQAAGRDRHVDFYTLIELFSIAELRRAGVSMKTLRANRAELSKRFSTPYPLALKGLLTDGRRLVKELGKEALLELGTGGQSSFESVLAPFCLRLDFDANSHLAARYFPVGREVPVVVSPLHAFGRPVIDGTNITTEAIGNLVRGGEDIADIAQDYDLPEKRIQAAWNFENRLAA